MADNHIDSMLLALRPGVFLARHDGIRDMLPDTAAVLEVHRAARARSGRLPRLRRRGPGPHQPLHRPQRPVHRRPDTVLVNADCTGLLKTLDAEGFTVVPVRHRHRRLFGGGFHCFTLDTHRDRRACEDYLS